MNRYLLLAKTACYKFLSFLAGEVCISCGNNFGFICEKCLSKLPYNTNFCRRCGFPLQTQESDKLCGECLLNPPKFDFLYAPYIYDGVIKFLIHEAKFHKKTFYFDKLMEIATNDLLIRFEKFRNFDVIIPVPVSRKRLLERGYNQSIEIAKLLSKLIKKPILYDTLVKVKETLPQTHFGRDERFKNVKNVFFLKKPLVSDKVILVDDIVTTTATIREASKVLKKGGADEIAVFAIARARN